MPDYKSDAGLLAHLQQQAATIDQYQTEAGASVADVTEIKHDAANMAALMDFTPLTDDYKKTAYGIKLTVVRGEINVPVGEFMDAPDSTMPFPLMSGIEKRSRDRDGRFKRASGISEAALEALDLNDGKPQPPDVPTPTIETFPAKTGYEFAVVINNRGDSDMIDLYMQHTGSTAWQLLKSGTGKSINVVIQPTTPGQPEQILVRAQLKKKNENYGEPSEPAYVTVSP